MLQSVEALLLRLGVIHETMNFIGDYLNTRIEKLMLQYRVWRAIEQHLTKIMRLVPYIESDAMFDPRYNRFSSQLVVAYNNVIEEFVDSKERELHVYEIGELPHCEIGHMLNFRRYERIVQLPLDLRRIVFGYVVGNLRATCAALRDMAAADAESNIFYENIIDTTDWHKDAAAEIDALRTSALNERIEILESFLDMVE